MTKKQVLARSLGTALAATLAVSTPVLAGHDHHVSWGFGGSVVAGGTWCGEEIDPWYGEPLDGYGEWVRVVPFDGPVWFPYVDEEWRPYVHGRWICTTLGMMWVAYEPWGWLTHHYGRWVYWDGPGWGWVPGDEYGPAWVTWVVADGCVGWAPLPPEGFRYRGAAHRYYGHRSPWWRPAEHAFIDIDFNLFVFVEDHHFHDREIHRHVVPSRRSVSFFREKKAVPVGRSLGAEDVRAITGERIEPVRVEQRSYRSGGRRITDYEPAGRAAQIRESREKLGRTMEAAASRIERRKTDSGARARDSAVPAPRSDGNSSIRRDGGAKSRVETRATVTRGGSSGTKEHPVAEKERSSGAKVRSEEGKRRGTDPAEARRSAASQGSRKKR